MINKLNNRVRFENITKKYSYSAKLPIGICDHVMSLCVTCRVTKTSKLHALKNKLLSDSISIYGYGVQMVDR
jgi:hypothetical protein